jgi:hypothetical protein
LARIKSGRPLHCGISTGEATTIEFMRDELAVEEYLDGLIDRCVKRLTQLKAFKSVLKPARL